MLGNNVRRWQPEQRDWAEWDLEHPYVPKAEYEAEHNLGQSVKPDVEAMQGGSAEEHLNPDGTFTDERQALHDSIVSDTIGGHASQDAGDRYITIMGGGSASGKSSMVNSGMVDLPPDAVHIDADQMKAQLPEAKEMQASGDDSWAAYTHEESSYLAQRATTAAEQNGQNILLDGTGDSNLGKLVGKIDAAHEAGYKANGVYATIPVQTAIDRSNDRGAKTGRYVPESAIRQIYGSVGKVVPSAAEKFDSFKLYDNTDNRGAGPSLIAEAHGPGTLTVHDQDRWKSFTEGNG